jgi:hypothetical protein
VAVEIFSIREQRKVKSISALILSVDYLTHGGVNRVILITTRLLLGKLVLSDARNSLYV